MEAFFSWEVEAPNSLGYEGGRQNDNNQIKIKDINKLLGIKFWPLSTFSSWHPFPSILRKKCHVLVAGLKYISYSVE